MFTRKKKKIEVPTIETRTVTVPTAHGLKDMITPAVATAAAMAKEKTQDAAQQAGGYLEQVKPLLEQGRDLAAQQASQAKDKVSDKVGDTAKLSEFLASGAAAREIATQRSRDAALVLKGEAKVKRVKKGGGFAKVVVNLGLLATIGALVAVAVQKLQQPKDDPWARPLTDPYVAPAAGRDSTVAGGEGVKVADVSTASTTTPAPAAPAAGTVTETVTETEIIPAEGQVPTTGAIRTDGEIRNN